MGHKKLDNVRTGQLRDAYALAIHPTTVGQYQAGVEAMHAQVAAGGVPRFALQIRRGSTVTIADTTNETRLDRALSAYVERAGERVMIGAEFALVENPALATTGELVMPDLEGQGASASAQHPMVLVCRTEVALWLNGYLTPKIRQITGDVTLRAVLPSEETWEHAATCGGELNYATLTGQLQSRATGGKLAHYDEQSSVRVGTYPANPWGFCDMTGLVEEMTSSLLDPSNPLVFCDRGGSRHNDNPLFLLAAGRGSSGADGRYDDFGFRVGLAQDSA